MPILAQEVIIAEVEKTLDIAKLTFHRPFKTVEDPKGKKILQTRVYKPDKKNMLTPSDYPTRIGTIQLDSDGKIPEITITNGITRFYITFPR